MGNYIFIEKDLQTINLIQRIVEDTTDLVCYGIAENYENAIELILKSSPVLVFYNVDEITNDFLQLIRELHQYEIEMPKFIAIANNKSKAYDAINNNFSHYLVKPVSEIEVIKALLKFKKNNSDDMAKIICLKSYKDYQYINAQDILYLKADNNTTELFLRNGFKVNAFKTLKTFEKMLPQNFLRIHKSYIVNGNHISRIDFGKLHCTIKNVTSKIPFTNNYSEGIHKLNNKLFRKSILAAN